MLLKELNIEQKNAFKQLAKSDSQSDIALLSLFKSVLTADKWIILNDQIKKKFSLISDADLLKGTEKVMIGQAINKLQQDQNSPLINF